MKVTIGWILHFPRSIRTRGDVCEIGGVDGHAAGSRELPPEQREVFIAHELDGESFKDIAARTRRCRQHPAGAQGVMRF